MSPWFSYSTVQHKGISECAPYTPTSRVVWCSHHLTGSKVKFASHDVFCDMGWIMIAEQVR